MILDSLTNASLFYPLGSHIRRALEFAQSTDLLTLELGRHTIDGDKLFALVQEYQPKPANQGRYEAHRRYWDLQIVARGEEAMGWNRLEAMQIAEPHSNEKDVAFFQGTGFLFLVPAGNFTIFAPHDVHLPGVETVRSEQVRKVVIKMDGTG
jgi:YhcH/YjgK/YiaL family protein